MKSRLLKNAGKTEKGLLFSGIILRIIVFTVNLFIGGHNCDETMTSLNAFSLADRMTDINGERLPVYFDNWVIGGQSPFATYLTAFSVKLFGENTFAVRLPALIFSILGIIALYFFAKEIFKDNRHINAIIGLGAICPWMLYSGAYVLDCNYLGHLLIFAYFFLAKGVNSKKTVYYIISMLFFALGFYCYIASVLLIPFLLITFYLILLIKKKISFKIVIISVLTVAVVALPFVLWGLVVLKIIPEFSLFGFSFSTMPDFTRSSDTVFAAEGAVGILTGLFTNLAFSMVLLVINDLSITALGSNIFTYGFLLSGIIGTLGFAKVMLNLLKKNNELNFNTKLFAAGSLGGIVAFCAFVNEPHLGSLYRYGVLSYLILIFVTIGLVDIYSVGKKLLKKEKDTFTRFLCIYLSLSFAVFCYAFAFTYVPQVYTTSELSNIQENFGDPFFKCLDMAEENGYDYVVVYKTPQVRMNTSSYERYYLYGKKDFYSIEDEIANKNTHMDDKGNYLVTVDGTLAYNWIEYKNTVDSDFAIAETEHVKELKFDRNEYKTKQFGFWTAIYK